MGVLCQIISGIEESRIKKKKNQYTLLKQNPASGFLWLSSLCSTLALLLQYKPQHQCHASLLSHWKVITRLLLWSPSWKWVGSSPLEREQEQWQPFAPALVLSSCKRIGHVAAVSWRCWLKLKFRACEFKVYSFGAIFRSGVLRKKTLTFSAGKFLHFKQIIIELKILYLKKYSLWIGTKLCTIIKGTCFLFSIKKDKEKLNLTWLLYTNIYCS